MEMSMGFKIVALLLAHLVVANGQVSTPCTLSMISSFTPCLNFITGSTNNGTSPTGSCCTKLKSIIGTGVDCACLILTGGVPLQLPINRTLALSLPSACKTGGEVPLQCTPSGSPLPAPGPVLLGPSVPPTTTAASSPFSPRASKVSAIAPTPQSKGIEQSRPRQAASEAPRTIRPVVRSPAIASSTPNQAYIASSHVLIIIALALAFMSY